VGIELVTAEGMPGAEETGEGDGTPECEATDLGIIVD
jgi:hypothetical protein